MCLIYQVAVIFLESIDLNMIDILLLEDEPADAYLVKMALKENKILANLHHVVDGCEGLDFLHKSMNWQIVSCGSYNLMTLPHD